MRSRPFRIGLVGRVVPPDLLDASVSDLVATMVALSPMT